MSTSLPIPVALVSCADYAATNVEFAVGEAMGAAGIGPGAGTRVLVKPNMLAAAPGGLACTHPAVVRAVCVRLLDMGCRVEVGDSPAFGTAKSVARKLGITEALHELGVPVVNLNRTHRIRLSFGASIGVARRALEADLILNVPKLKAHCQMRLTGAVKNLFGVVPGTRKAIAHTRHGDKDNRFESMIVEIMDALPPAPSVVDGITAMQRQGPRGGDPYPLGLVGASTSPVALDTALYAILGVDVANIPLGAELVRRAIPGATLDEISLPMKKPEAFDASGFVFPHMIPVTFNPLTLFRSSLQRAWHRLLSH